MKKVFRLFVTVAIAASLIGTPVALMAQQGDVKAQACTQAQADVQKDVNNTLWLAAGFLLGLVGVAVAYIYEPTPPSSNLLGKSPEYVAAYTDCYRETAKKLQTNAAVKGCVIGTLVSIGTYAACMALSLSAANTP